MLSKSCEYGIRAILYLSMNSSRENKIGIKLIAEELSIPAAFLNKVLQRLVKKNLVYSAKGKTGGFFTDESIRKYTLFDIVKAIDGVKAFDCCSLGLRVCSSKNPCVLHENFQRNRINLLKKLKGTIIGASANSVQLGLLRIKG